MGEHDPVKTSTFLARFRPNFSPTEPFRPAPQKRRVIGGKLHAYYTRGVSKRAYCQITRILHGPNYTQITRAPGVILERFWGQVGAKRAPIVVSSCVFWASGAFRSPRGPVEAPFAAQGAPRMPVVARGGPEVARRWPGGDPRWPEVARRRPGGGPEVARGGPRWPGGGPELARRLHEVAWRWPEVARRWPEAGPDVWWQLFRSAAKLGDEERQSIRCVSS